MTAKIQFDDEIARRVEAMYLTPDVVEQRRATRATLALRPGERVLDIGSGPGFLVVEMAEDVAPDGRVHGLDPSESMLAHAARRVPPDGAAPIEFQTGVAASLPYADDAFDVVVATQVLEYVDDVPAALAEIRRVARPHGRVLILDTDWDSIVWRSSDDRRMARVLAAWDEHLADPRLPRRLAPLLVAAGFPTVEPAVIPILNVGYRPDCMSAGAMEIVASFVPGRGGVSADEAAAWLDDLRGLGEDYFFSLNRYLFLAR